jgi:iron complex transport system ATP-binding protein
MGRDKSRLLLGGKTFLQRIINTSRHLDVPVELIIEDDTPGLGPLGGVATAFNRFRFERALFLSCDMPLITPELLRQFAAAKGPVFASDNDRPGFPFLLPRTAGAGLKLSLKENRYSLQELSRTIKAELLIGSREELANVNTATDYKTVARIWKKHRQNDSVLEVRNLAIQRGSTRMVSDFSWRVRKGEHWAVLGANGCGKTSLFSSLLGYVTLTRGDIFVLGEEYGDSDWPALRQKIGMVSSSVRQMMAESEPAWITVASGKYAMIDFWGTPNKSDKAEAFDLLKRIECEHIANRPWAVLSQGERQRVLIARSLMARPALLILDEPCAGLDPAAREHFLSFLDRLGQSRGCPAIVLVTHHVEEVMPVFTHVLLMKQGWKLAEGPVPQMLSSELLSKTFDTPIEVRKEGERYTLRVEARRAVRQK